MSNEVLDGGGVVVLADRTEHWDSYPERSRPYHLEMPLVTGDLASLMQYPVNDALAFCIPIAYAEEDFSSYARYVGYCKASLFLAQQMLLHWDVRATGVPIFIGVCENGREIFDSYAAHCHFPASNIIALPAYTYKQHGWGVKWDLLGAPELSHFARRLHFDASWWLRSPSVQPDTSQRFLDAWQDEDILLYYPEIYGGDPAKPWTLSVFRFTTLDFFDRLGGLLGTDPAVERAYWSNVGCAHIAGDMFGFSDSYWQTLTPLRRRLATITDLDEAVLGVMARELRWESESVLYGASTLIPDLQYMTSFDHLRKETEELHIMQEFRKGVKYTPGERTCESLSA